MKVLENTPAVLSLGKLCDESGYSYEWINGQKPHLIQNGIRIPCNTENFVPTEVPGLSNSPSGSDRSTSWTLSRQGSHCSTSSSSSSSSPSVSDTETREREDRIESDITPVTVSTTVDERSGRPDIVDITLRSALGSSGEPRPRAADIDGAVLAQARIDKESTYPELVASTRCFLVVVAVETGGRWSEEAVQFVWQMAQTKAREAPRFLAHQVALAWERRWTRMLSVACASSFAASLVEPMTCELSCQTGGDLPTTADILATDHGPFHVISGQKKSSQ